MVSLPGICSFMCYYPLYIFFFLSFASLFHYSSFLVLPFLPFRFPFLSISLPFYSPPLSKCSADAIDSNIKTLIALLFSDLPHHISHAVSHCCRRPLCFHLWWIFFVTDCRLTFITGAFFWPCLGLSCHVSFESGHFEDEVSWTIIVVYLNISSITVFWYNSLIYFKVPSMCMCITQDLSILFSSSLAFMNFIVVTRYLVSTGRRLQAMHELTVYKSVDNRAANQQSQP